MTDTVIVQLGRTGDVLNVLPICQHFGWAICTRPEYASACRGCSSITTEEWEGAIEDWAGAERVMRERYRRAIVTQLFPNYRQQRRATPQYCLDEWERAGALELYGTLPLVFDRRDASREASLWRTVDDGRPALLLSLIGISGPFRDSAWLDNEIRREWGARFNVINLPSIKAERFYDLLGLYDRAAGLVTIDTSTLHLCWASKVPAIQLLSFEPEDWHGSTTKGNCVFSCKYREAKDKIGNIHAAIERWVR
jgi:hypothetical protein